MILSIHSAELLETLGGPMWLVYFYVPDTRFPIMRMIPAGQPTVCPGGMWCEDFGCVPGDNVFTRAETELLVEEGTEVPAEFNKDEVWDQARDVDAGLDWDWDESYECEVCGLFSCDCGPCTCETGCENCISENI